MQRLLRVLLTAGLFVTVSPILAHQNAPKPTRAEMVQADLWVALAGSNYEAVKAAIKAGADVNASGSSDMGKRGTMQHSSVMNTFMVLRMLKAYLPTDRKEEMERRIAKAKAWTLGMKPTSAEDLAARVLALKAAGGDAKEIGPATRQLVAAQRRDGGWGVPNSSQSDAYTTGVSLYALRTAA